MVENSQHASLLVSFSYRIPNSGQRNSSNSLDKVDKINFETEKIPSGSHYEEFEEPSSRLLPELEQHEESIIINESNENSDKQTTCIEEIIQKVVDENVLELQTSIFTERYKSSHLTQLLKDIKSYKTINDENEFEWFNNSSDVISHLKQWRTIYKLLDYRKRYLKKLSATIQDKEDLEDDVGSDNEPLDSSYRNRIKLHKR
ncbi:hypothetical protein WICMUC_005337 [Wickerhamomyces mucosus]|uniref:Uncharacterized protein n=1 Tax=Wickerhamomyces mucosus TaxID=1378264 RepID=A0A9P8P865_9ASCO|nr:hypothetical protein WICMUC_005337 [Wickerhamomyces mucosus]